RSAASKAARSKAMESFLKAAREHKAGVADGPLDDQERLKILAGLSRASNPAIQTRAVLAYHQLERDIANRANASQRDTLDILQDIGLHAPELAAQLAAEQGISFEFTDAERRQRAEKHL